MTTLEEIIEIARHLGLDKPQPPRATTLEVGDLAHAVLMLCAPRRNPAIPPDPIAQLTGIAIVPNGDMDPSAWRVLDQHGNVMKEGQV